MCCFVDVRVGCNVGMRIIKGSKNKPYSSKEVLKCVVVIKYYSLLFLQGIVLGSNQCLENDAILITFVLFSIFCQ